jgi:SAM-dependent methyltransferase
MRLWEGGDFVRAYAKRELRPPEVLILVRYRDDFRGRALELGCGAGRITGYLIELADEVQAIDISPAMVAYCQATYPDGSFQVRDIRDLSAYEDDSQDVAVAGFNLLDVLDDAGRREVLGELARIVVSGGLFVMSSHNLAHAALLRPPWPLRGGSPVRTAAQLVRAPRRISNNLRLRRFEERGSGYAILNDEAHAYQFLHYYIDREAQERQLGDAGFALLECLDTEGHVVPKGADAATHSELHYIARRAI